MTKNRIFETVQMVPVQDLVAFKSVSEKEITRYDVPFLRVTTYVDGTVAIYPINMEQIASEHLLHVDTIDIYWDWLEYKGEPYGDSINDYYYNPFPSKAV